MGKVGFVGEGCGELDGGVGVPGEGLCVEAGGVGFCHCGVGLGDVVCWLRWRLFGERIGIEVRKWLVSLFMCSLWYPRVRTEGSRLFGASCEWWSSVSE